MKPCFQKQPKIDLANGKTAGPGYYPGFDTLSQQSFWDKTTREVVLKRVRKKRELHFFTPQEARVMEVVFDHLMPQSDRSADQRIEILGVVDERLANNRLDGYRFEGMPSDQEAYRLGMQAIEEIAKAEHDHDFLSLTALEQDKLLKTLHDGRPSAAHAIWKRMPVQRYWLLILQDAIEAYYAHPFAWNEVGFGGPAYPRAYMRLERGEPEPWEVEEKRYEWSAPEDSVSSSCEPVGGSGEYHGSPGQGGTH